MRRFILQLAALLAAIVPSAARAELPAGTRAPLFTTQGALAGRTVPVDLRALLRRGPVVLYFYPKAFTKGCTLEARAFAEAHDRFAAMGATVIGLSNDDLPTLQRFSAEECRSKFAVGVATPAITSAYDVGLSIAGIPSGATDRTTYVIARNGRIGFVHSELDYRDHVRLALIAVESLHRQRR